MIDLLILLAAVAACTALMVACAYARPALRLTELAVAALPLSAAWRRAAPWTGGSLDDLPLLLRALLLVAALLSLGLLAALAARRPTPLERSARSFASRSRTRSRYRSEVRGEVNRRIQVYYQDGGRSK